MLVDDPEFQAFWRRWDRQCRHVRPRALLPLETALATWAVAYMRGLSAGVELAQQQAREPAAP